MFVVVQVPPASDCNKFVFKRDVYDIAAFRENLMISEEVKTANRKEEKRKFQFSLLMIS